jgi:UDP-sulfoquinovose synthase
VYGRGGQTRGFLNIKDTLRCVELSLLNPAREGEFRVFNQFTEQFSVMDLAERVQRAGRVCGLDVKLDHVPNPRVEKEEHYYNARHTALVSLGLEPHLLTDDVLAGMIRRVQAAREHIDETVIYPTIKWRQPSQAMAGTR